MELFMPYTLHFHAPLLKCFMPNILENGGNFGKNSINVVVIFTA